LAALAELAESHPLAHASPSKLPWPFRCHSKEAIEHDIKNGRIGPVSVE